MKKTILMFGNDNFESIIYDNGRMTLKPNKLMAKLTTKNNIINFSNGKLNIEQALDTLKLFTASNIKIDGCYLALSDLLNKSQSLELFEGKIVEVIEYLRENNINCFIFDKLSKDCRSAIEYENLISYLSNCYSFKPVAHRTIELYAKENTSKNTITNLCI